MSRLNLRIYTLAMQTICCALLLAVSANGANLTVKSGGGGNYTTIQACATAMSPGDTCTVYAGTYNENVKVPAGAAGNYKTITVNGSDVVTVQAFSLGSHTKLLGNCPEKQGTVTTATCGFFISNPSSPASARCVGLADGTTDVYIRNNVMYACGSYSMAGLGSANSTPGVSNVYIQGNTLSYACVTQAQAQAGTPKECNGIVLHGTNDLVENNDLSHYTLGLHFDDLSLSIMRNNTLHDQVESEAGGNSHTDAYFVEPTATATQHNVIEGNYQHDTFGSNAKGMVIQGQDSPCVATLCTGIIFRYNTAANLDGANLSGFAWDAVKMYNNTYVNVGRVINTSGGSAIDDMRTLSGVSFSRAAALNNIYYFGFQVTQAGTSNVWGFDSASAATSRWGNSLAYCNVSGASNCFLYGHLYNTSTWAAEPGNLYGRPDTVPTNNPNFVNLAGNDFHLQSNSPAIGRGTYLTTAIGSGSSSTSLVVSDANYFQYGYGLSNAYSTVNGDCISVTTVGNHVCITAINYSTNTLTLANPISWSNGDPIWLYSKSDGVQVLTGSVPDMGAYPNGSGGGGSAPAPPSNLSAVVN
jgi:hypothetical protein